MNSFLLFSHNSLWVCCMYICVQIVPLSQLHRNMGELLWPTSKPYSSSSLLLPTSLYFLLRTPLLILMRVNKIASIPALSGGCATWLEIFGVRFVEKLIFSPLHRVSFPSLCSREDVCVVSRFLEELGCYLQPPLTQWGAACSGQIFGVLLCNSVVS